MADLLDEGAEPSTTRARQLGVRRFSAWLEEEGEIDTDPLLGLKVPKLDTKIVASLSDGELRRLIKACGGKEFRDRRDEAIVRLMSETGMRAGELIALTMADVDLERGLVTVRRGKGGEGRTAPFGATTARAIDRYIRARRTHRLADTPALWLGTAAKNSPTSGCATHCNTGQNWPASRAFICTCCATPRLRDAWICFC